MVNLYEQFFWSKKLRRAEEDAGCVLGSFGTAATAAAVWGWKMMENHGENQGENGLMFPTCRYLDQMSKPYESHQTWVKKFMKNIDVWDLGVYPPGMIFFLLV
jgi:hypothetical protein